MVVRSWRASGFVVQGRRVDEASGFDQQVVCVVLRGVGGVCGVVTGGAVAQSVLEFAVGGHVLGVEGLRLRIHIGA